MSPDTRTTPQGQSTMASGNDIKAAEATYSGFINLLKFGMIGTAIITIIVIALIV